MTKAIPWISIDKMTGKDRKDFRPEAAIFDMDGLMLETEAPFAPAWVQAGKEAGYDIGPEIIQATIGIDGEGTRRILTEKFGPDFPLRKIWDQVIRLVTEDFERGIALKPGLIALLDHLSEKKIPVGVATSTRRDGALWKLTKAGIEDRFEIITCGDEVVNGKPAPDIFLLAARRMGVDPSICVGFEDSPPGLLGLHRAGIASVFVKDQVQPSPEILATVWKTYPDLGQALELF
ncbi:MAG: HAD family phosphatase [Treponema sp.]|nr:HAD family phosphatase [Treponema sp.]